MADAVDPKAKGKLVIAISSRALFDLDESHQIFKEHGVEAYAKHQEENEEVVLNPGVGFTLVKKLLNLNTKQNPIDVILLSRNSADTGLRIFNSIEHYGLNISRAAFTRGESTHNLVGAFEADAANALGLPMMVKPACAGSSVGMTIARTVHDIEPAVNKAFGHDEHIIMEKYINGREFTCGVLGNDEIQALPVIEIIPGKNHEFFDYKAKYIHGETNEICPAEISKTITQKIQHLALKAHNTLFLKGYSRTDMILSNGELSVLETNTIPGMTSTSLYPKSAQAAGYSFTALLDRLIDLAIENHEKQKLRRSI
jgi:D-alanine--D-alanine ligase